MLIILMYIVEIQFVILGELFFLSYFSVEIYEYIYYFIDE